MATSSEKNSAELQREIDLDRRRIEDRLDAIQERMSPGQIVDEVLAYARSSGGGEYVGNLGNALKANPLPVALIGVSLAWLMAKQGTSPTIEKKTQMPAQPEYPLYQAEGAIRRISAPEVSDGALYSHFSDSTGRRLKALTDESGRRAGHFLDDAGNAYRGFADKTGKQITQVVDETGTLLDEASGWASQKWEQAKNIAGDMTARASDAASSLSNRSSSAAGAFQEQAGKLHQAILTQFRDQPLVGGALAFAVGAAIGAALPHTETEDELLGETSDSAKEAVTAQASDAIAEGKAIASDAYDKAVAAASDVHDAVKDRVVDEVKTFKVRTGSGEHQQP